MDFVLCELFMRRLSSWPVERLAVERVDEKFPHGISIIRSPEICIVD
jgi:hypothetical protein